MTDLDRRKPGRIAGRPLALAALLMALLLGLGGCSRFGLIYDRLDLVAGLQLRAFVSLDEPQEAIYRSAFERTWRWHRSTQLPRYASLLRDLAAAVESPLPAADLLAYEQRIRLDSLRVGEELLRGSVPVVASFNDAQISDFLAEMDERVAKSRRQQQRLSDADWVRERYDEAVDRWDDWSGAVTPEQRLRLESWAQSLGPLRSRDNESAYRLFRADLLALLAERQSADFGPRLEAMILREPPNSARIAAWREARQALLLDLSDSATAAQRAHLRERLLALAAELDQLARRPG